MTLIKNISGFRGTVEGPPKENLTPFDVVTSVSAFCKFLKEKHGDKKLISPAPNAIAKFTVIISRLWFKN